jgi:hypothetical protein
MWLPWLVLAVSPLIAHAVGAVVAALVRVRPGRAADRMPGLPARDDKAGTPMRRFERSVRRVEGRMLRWVLDQPQGVEAQALAAALGEDPEVVGEVLTRWRSRAPCRLQVTERGRLLHDFQPDDVRKLSRARLLTGPGRWLLMAVAAVANVGAAWPLAVTGVLAAVTLGGMLFTGDDGGIAVVLMALAGLLAVAVVFGLNLLLGLVFRVVLAPWIGGPRFRDAFGPQDDEDRPQDSDTPGIFSVIGDLISGAVKQGLGAALVACVIAVALSSLAGLVLWGRGLWRAVSRRDPVEEELSPGDWAHEAPAPDTLEGLVPTSDLVMTLTRAIGRAVAARRPVDGRMAARVRERARRHGGWVAQLDLQIEEGLPADEALAVGARLSGAVGGEIETRDDGSIDFFFPAEALLGEVVHGADPSRPAAAECVPSLRAVQPVGAVPVALPGLALGHLQGSERLVGGTVLMVITGLIALAMLAPLSAWAFAVGLALAALASGVMIIVASARYAARSWAKAAVFRDVRRLTLAAVRGALSHDTSLVDAAALADRLHATFVTAWPGLVRADVAVEVEATLDELDLGLDADALVDEPSGRPYLLTPLRQRLRFLQLARHRGHRAEPIRDDAIVFDTAAP